MQQADAVQAYVQADLKGTATWVNLPPEAWEHAPEQVRVWYDKNRSKFTKPVLRLKKALYGHPDSGTYWERHCDRSLQSVGFEPIINWPSCYVHKGLELLLIVYVDDFKLSGRASSLTEGWKLIRTHLEVEPETNALFLG